MCNLPSLERLRWFRPQLSALPAAALFAALTALIGVPVHAQNSDESPAPQSRLIALQYEDRLSSERQALTVSLPLPAVDIDHVNYRSSDCLGSIGSGSVLLTAPDPTIELELALPAPPLADEAARSCNSDLVLLFRQGERSWPAEASVVVTRLPELPQLGVEEVSTTFITDRISIPQHLQPSYSTTMVLLSITNLTSAPLTLRGFGDTAAFTSLIGPVYHYDPNSFMGTYESLLTSARLLEATTLGPGEAAHLAIVFDPDRRLPDAAGALTIRPVALVDSAGRLFVVPFPRLSTVWGPELR